MASQAKFVKYGYGQVEPNHLSAPQSGRVYAQLPAAADIDILENGQFVKYDYANKVCNFTGLGGWMMVFNEVKIYRDFETDADFAMKKQAYNARVYSPVGQDDSTLVSLAQAEGSVNVKTGEDYIYSIPKFNYPQGMPEGTKMVPRVMHIEVGDIYTTNMVDAASLENGNLLIIGDKGILKVAMDGPAATVMANHGGDSDPIFQVVKVYTMPDNQPGVKLMRVA